MINSDILLTMSETAMENPSFFPFPFPLHLTFAVIATVFLIFRFITNKKPYQLIMAIAIAISLALWIPSVSRTLYYTVGLIELILVAAAFVTSLIFKNKNVQAEENTATENSEVKE